ncbi:DUF7264 domain-containing protein [Hoyosella altamirensis]|uniref:LtfC/p132/Gp6 beta-sandwich domain-containing protein n=1 Tax=Hoyosella altamirensis TaxID=616997 RepID=A0A839RTB1_9ACTN|nr:hypothetical protein [Hoyosella altamirensis]MBB3039810.1 hypothetical protein [Hoyosella altamirensis]
MSAPPCTCGTVHLGDCPALLRLCIRPGAVLSKAIQLRDKTTGAPEDWPAGTTVWITFTRGAWDYTADAVVDGSYLRFTLDAEETRQIPKGSLARIWIQYPDVDGPIVWAEGHIEGCC